MYYFWITFTIKQCIMLIIMPKNNKIEIIYWTEFLGFVWQLSIAAHLSLFILLMTRKVSGERHSQAGQMIKGVSWVVKMPIRSERDK